MNRIWRSLIVVCVAAWATVVGAQPAAPRYDLIVRNGRIIDGSGNPWFYGDVAVRDGRVVAVGRVPPGEATQTIDAAGLFVAPGFIDMHSHSDTLLLEDGAAESKIRQGVTTEILGEGDSAGPGRSAGSGRARTNPRRLALRRLAVGRRWERTSPPSNDRARP